MFDTLNELLGVESRPLERQQFVHIGSSVEESGIANASFLIHHFISSFLKHGYKVFLVSCLHTLSQYKVVQHKLGVNLEQATSQGSFSFVSALNLCTGTDQPQATTCYGISTTTDCADERNAFSSISDTILDEIESKLNEVKKGSSTPSLIVFDDLSTLTDLGVCSADVLNMICRVKARYPDAFSTFLTASSRLNPESSTMDSCSLSKQLSHWSDLVFEVEQLSTGLSKDVHGQLKVSRRTGAVCAQPQQVYHYKVTERDLKLFAVGESPAVL